MLPVMTANNGRRYLLAAYTVESILWGAGGKDRCFLVPMFNYVTDPTAANYVPGSKHVESDYGQRGLLKRLPQLINGVTLGDATALLIVTMKRPTAARARHLHAVVLPISHTPDILTRTRDILTKRSMTMYSYEEPCAWPAKRLTMMMQDLEEMESAHREIQDMVYFFRPHYWQMYDWTGAKRTTPDAASPSWASFSSTRDGLVAGTAQEAAGYYKDISADDSPYQPLFREVKSLLASAPWPEMETPGLVPPPEVDPSAF